jgi:Fic family protein
MGFLPDKPFNDLPPLPPKTEIETMVTLKKAIAAGRALAELKGLGETIPNQSILVNSIILQEAKASSEIENIVTTHDALFQAFSANTSQIDPATKEVLRYREALWEGFRSLKDRPLLTSNLTRDKILAIRELLTKALEITKERLPPRVYSKDLIELLFHQPYTKGQFLVDAGIAKRQAAADYLKKLEEIGVLKVHKVGKENLYLNTKLYEILSK